MKEKFKKINWKNIGWRTLQSLIILFANGGTISFFVMKCIDIGDEVKFGDKVIQLDFIDALPFKFKIMVYISIVVGIAVSYLFIKFLWKERKEKNIRKEEMSNEEKRESVLDKKLEKIMGGK